MKMGLLINNPFEIERKKTLTINTQTQDNTITHPNKTSLLYQGSQCFVIYYDINLRYWIYLLYLFRSFPLSTIFFHICSYVRSISESSSLPSPPSSILRLTLTRIDVCHGLSFEIRSYSKHAVENSSTS